MILKLPPDWDCMIASMAMLMGVSYGDIERRLYDTKEQPFGPDGPILGVHIEHLQYLALNYGFALVGFVPGFEYNPTDNPLNNYRFDLVEQLYGAMQGYDGILLGRWAPGKHHAVVWSHEDGCVFEPTGESRPLDGFDLDTFYARIPTGKYPRAPFDFADG